METQQYPIRKYALLDENDVVLYIKEFSLSNAEESWLGNYEGARTGRAVDMFDYPIEIGMKWDGEKFN